jgi:hypothetical protein
LELGYRVVLIAEHQTGVGEWLRERSAKHVENFVFLARTDLREIPAPPGIARRLLIRARRPFDRIVSVAIRRSMWAKRVRDAFSSPPPPRELDFGAVADEIGVAERRLAVRPVLVFFLYLDMMELEPDGCRRLDERLSTPFAGILFHPCYEGTTAGRPEPYFECRHACGAAFLNPHRVEPYTRTFPDRVFGALPDVTDAATPDQSPELVKQFRARAGQRTIVALLGSLTAHKGIPEFLQLISRAEPRELFFVVIGEIFWESFGAQERDLRRFAAAPPENCFVHAGYLDDERVLNAAIAASDILYAVYPNQRDSSNTLTKAAIFEKPVVVSEQHLMGERVRTFRLGATVRFGDIDGILAALTRLSRQQPSEFGFATYRNAHSFEALRAGFGDLVARWTQSSGRSRQEGAATGQSSS